MKQYSLFFQPTYIDWSAPTREIKTSMPAPDNTLSYDPKKSHFSFGITFPDEVEAAAIISKLKFPAEFKTPLDSKKSELILSRVAWNEEFIVSLWNLKEYGEIGWGGFLGNIWVHKSDGTGVLQIFMEYQDIHLSKVKKPRAGCAVWPGEDGEINIAVCDYNRYIIQDPFALYILPKVRDKPEK